MSHQIIKQPNNNYCIWSTITDSFLEEDLTKEEVLEFFEEIYRQKLESGLTDVKETMDRLDKGEKPYYQFTMSYKEAKGLEKEVHGK